MKQLTVGETAPYFLVRDIEDNGVGLTDYTGKYLLVAFLRYAGCPWCNLAVHRLAMEAPLLQDNSCSIVAFVQSSKQNIISNIYERHAKTPAFPIISDDGHTAYSDYYVKPSLIKAAKHIINVPHWIRAVKKEGFTQGKIDGSLFLAPAVFIINPRGKIIRADYNANLYEHDTFSLLYDTIATDKLEMT